jgi:hypothetical protein
MKRIMSHKYATLVIALLVLSEIGQAQNLPDAPSVTVGSFPSVQVGTLAVISPSQSGGAAVSGKWPWIDMNVADTTYWNSTFALVGSTVLNVEMTARCSQQGTCLTYIAPHASRARLYAYTLPTDAALSYLAYRLKPKTHLWALPQLMFTGANLFSAGRSYARIQH